MSFSAHPQVLPVDDGATVWSEPPHRLRQALEDRPLLVAMHGLGSNERDLAALVPHLPDHLVVASLRAPLPVQLGGGAQGWAWFPLGQSAGAPELGYVDAATRGVLRWLEGVQARVRTPGPVALLGFSQGGAMATHLLRHAPEEATCAVVLSGFTVPGLVSGDEALAQLRPPVFWGRDVADPVIPAAAVDRTTAFLTGHTTLTARTYPGAGHGVAMQELADVARFLTEQLPA